MCPIFGGSVHNDYGGDIFSEKCLFPLGLTWSKKSGKDSSPHVPLLTYCTTQSASARGIIVAYVTIHILRQQGGGWVKS